MSALSQRIPPGLQRKMAANIQGRFIRPVVCPDFNVEYRIRHWNSSADAAGQDKTEC